MKSLFQLQHIFTFLSICLSLGACAQHNDSKTKDNHQSGIISGMPIADSSLANQSDSFWKARLSEEEYYILREKGTESPFTGKWLMNKDTGYYTCAACGNPLFKSDMKFDSECGWPSFDNEIRGGRVKTEIDYSHGMVRTEIMCANCGGHLGHLFDDGPTATGKRYCVNSVSIDFKKSNLFAVAVPQSDTIVLGGGCFWCTEAVYENLKGVSSVVAGYSGGTVANPSYQDVCTGLTNHAEVVRIIFNPSITSIDEILKVFFTVHDPTTLNRQGADEGTQYRSVIFYRDVNQKAKAESLIKDLNASGVYSSKIVTTIEPLKVFYEAENYHQDYFENNMNQPYCKMVIMPKLEKFEKVFKDRIKN